MEHYDFTNLLLGAVVCFTGGSCDMTVVSIDTESEEITVAWTNTDDQHEEATYWYGCFRLK